VHPHGVDDGGDQANRRRGRQQQDEYRGDRDTRPAGVRSPRTEQAAGHQEGHDADRRRPDPAPAPVQQPDRGGDGRIGFSGGIR
jgi:hypothetical protein